MVRPEFSIIRLPSWEFNSRSARVITAARLLSVGVWHTDVEEVLSFTDERSLYLAIGPTNTNDVAGAAEMRVFPDCHEAKLLAVVVRGELRGQGYGRYMLSALEECARNAGASTMKLISSPEAIGFYDVMGYAAVSLIDGGYRNMVKDLNR
jgi:GNAT superfamily N-acetyltransferase